MLPYFSLNALDFAKTFGLGIAVLLFWIFSLLKEKDDYKIKERKHSEDLLDITRENIETMSSMTNLIQAIAPAISSSSIEGKRQVDEAIDRLKEHISNQTEILKLALGGNKKND